MRQIYLAATYYQMIAAIQIRQKLFPWAEASLIITDNSSGYHDVANRLRGTRLFSNVFEATSTRDLTVNTVQHRIGRIMDILLDREYFPIKNSSQYSWEYDEFLFFNFNYLTTSVLYYLYKRNPKIICRRFEEGYTSGFDFKIFTTKSSKMQEKVRRVHNNPSIYNVEEMYFFEPDMVLFDKKICNISQIPKIQKEDQDIKDNLNFIFDYHAESIYDKKYIFFEESYMADNIKIYDEELILKIAEKVGHDNLMIKMHPRNHTDRFSKYGIKTIGQSGIPWEVIIMNHDFSDKVFLTIASGSVLSPRIIFGDNVPTFMLYNCTSIKPPMLQKKGFKDYMEKFKQNYGTSGFYVPDNFDEFLAMLK